MNKEEKTFFITIAVALGLLWFFKPKGTSIIEMGGSSSTSGDKYQEPKVASADDQKEKENAVIGLQAMRDAMNNKESKRELDKLNSMITQEYGVKITTGKAGKLRAMSKSGKLLAEES